MKKQQPTKPKPTSQEELLQYETEAAKAREAVKAAKQRVRKAKATYKTARKAHRELKRSAAEALKVVKDARKYLQKHPPGAAPRPVSNPKRTRKKSAPRKPAKQPPVIVSASATPAEKGS